MAARSRRHTISTAASSIPPAARSTRTEKLLSVMLGTAKKLAATTASRASRNDPASNSGTRNSRSLATNTSTVASRPASTATLAATAATPTTMSSPPGRPSAMPHGANRFASSASRTVSRIPAAHSTSASRGPAYSRTIASCTIVSSRWVAGLSTGSRPVSATMTITSAAKASNAASDTTCSGCVMVWATNAPRFAEPAGMDNAKTASKMVGSTSAAMVISRLAPMPPNDGAGVDAGQGQRDGAHEEQPDHGEQVGAGVQRRPGGDQRCDRGDQQRRSGHHGGCGREHHRRATAA